MSKPTRVLLVDDHESVREMFRSRINQEEGLLVVADAADAQSAITLGAAAQPDVLVMDIDMPGLSCFDAAKRLGTLVPSLKVLFLSAFFHDRYIEQALQVGAMGYVTKREPASTVVTAIQTIASGGAYFSPEVWSRMVVQPGGVRLGARDGKATKAAMLTPRELEVIRYIARGLSRKDTASLMKLSPKTIARHTENLMAKLDIHDRAQLTRYAINEGLAE